MISRSRLAPHATTVTVPKVERSLEDEGRLTTAVKDFAAATRHFHRQNYEKAREILERLADSAPAVVADRARVHLRLCLQRLERRTPTPKTAADFHILGVSELNARQLDLAVEHLSRACKLEPKREEIRYALAAAHALQGNADAALEHLRVAIELRPQNRYQARHDPDFESLGSDARFRSLVMAEGPRISS
jgi:tetratricopeptide (TPR) repeat protein